MEVHERLLRTVPDYADARALSETRAWRLATGRSILARSGVTVIPVVVHVVYKTNAQNISAAQIQSQIAILNHDYRKTNPDIASTPAAFNPLIADARIEFALAGTDPAGNPTDGIIRTQTTADSFSQDDRVKASATGGADPWPSDRYLNIWVCQLGGGLLGYAQFPGGPTDTDGVVILHTGFGSTGTAAAPFNLGRTATHEIGHWLNLRHIWGDDGTGCNGSDFVNDTPNAAGPNFGTPAFPKVTCSNGPNGDLFMNYMDYVDDAAMVMFSNDQVTRMQACLDGDRPSIGAIKSFGTLKFRDEQPTLKFADEPLGTLKFIDDVKQPFFDKSPASDVFKQPGGDVAGPFNPATVVNPAPFVLSSPHHSMAWTRQFPDAQRQEMDAYGEQIRQYEQVLTQYAAAETAGQLADEDRDAGDRLFGDYVRLLEEYQQLAGG